MDSNLKRMIAKFLAECRESDGGYAPVTESDMEQLEAIIAILVSTKFEPDPDGDFPVEWKLINRNTHHGMHYRPVPYSLDAGPESALDIHQAITLNFGLANDDMSRYHREFEDVLRGAVRDHKKKGG